MMTQSLFPPSPLTAISPRIDDGSCPQSSWTASLEIPNGGLTDDPRLEDARRIIAAADAILGQGEDMLRNLSDESYTSHVPLAFNASIGGHYRHCLDHFTSLVRGLDSDEVDYDHRDRDLRIETRREIAIAITQQLRERIAQIQPATLAIPLKARCEVSYSHGSCPMTGSSLGRELVYAIAHAIHHYALISIMARLMEARLPENFGVAPSTVAHQTKVGRH